MEWFKLRYLEVQTAVGGAVGTAVYFISDEWWALALGIMAGAALAFYKARKALKNLGLPASATFGEYAEELRKKSCQEILEARSAPPTEALRPARRIGHAGFVRQASCFEGRTHPRS